MLFLDFEVQMREKSTDVLFITKNVHFVSMTNFSIFGQP